jgi:hypothetical protein
VLGHAELTRQDFDDAEQLITSMVLAATAKENRT